MWGVFMCKHAVHTDVGLIVCSNEIQECKVYFNFVYDIN